MGREQQRARRGATLPLVAAGIFTMLALGAVAIDLGMLFSVRAQAQRTADAAALAGASQFTRFADSTAAVTPADSAARAFAKKNFIQSTRVSDADILSVTPNAANRTVRVVIQRAGVRNWFAATFGFRTSTVNAAATAQASLGGAVQCAKPIAIPDLWSEPGRPNGGDTLGTALVPAPNRVWDLPPPPASGGNGNGNGGGNGNNVPGYSTVPTMEEWRWRGTAGQTYVAPGSASSTGWGTSYRNGLPGYYLGATNFDIGRRMALMIMDANGNDVDIQPSSFFQAWLPNGMSGKNDLANAIRDGCDIGSTSVGTADPNLYQSNGLGTGQIGRAWDDLYNQDPGATWNDAATDPGGTNWITGSNKCPSSGPCLKDDWIRSPRVITVGVYNPTLYATAPSNNKIAFVNFARVFVEQPFRIGNGANAKRWVMGRFAGPAQGIGAGNGGATGTLVYTLRLIK
jgi:Flp pilus assembly protein TadG